MLTWNVKKGEEDLPLIDFLLGKIPLASAPYLRQLIRSGKVLHNGRKTDDGLTVRCNDSIAVPGSRRLLDLLERETKRPLILFESDRVLVVHKPSGLATHSSKGHERENLTDRVRAWMLAEKKTFRIAPVHRLDLPTSGPVIFGKGQKAISALGSLIQEQQIGKKYLALVRTGLPEPGKLAGFVPAKGKLKQAETDYLILERHQDLTLLELSLKTGRQHQIRKQLADRGHPIAGDDRYRGLSLPGLERLFLHCHQLTFTDPFDMEVIRITDPLPAALAEVLACNQFTYGTAEPNVPIAKR